MKRMKCEDLLRKRSPLLKFVVLVLFLDLLMKEEEKTLILRSSSIIYIIQNV